MELTYDSLYRKYHVADLRQRRHRDASVYRLRRQLRRGRSAAE
jgi:hypothetical protein